MLGTLARPQVEQALLQPGTLAACSAHRDGQAACQSSPHSRGHRHAHVAGAGESQGVASPCASREMRRAGGTALVTSTVLLEPAHSVILSSHSHADAIRATAIGATFPCCNWSMPVPSRPHSQPPFPGYTSAPSSLPTILMTAVQRTGWFEWDATVSSLSTEQTSAHEWAGPVTPATRIERAFQLGISPPVPCTSDDHTSSATALLTAVTVTKLCRLSASPTQPQVASCLASARGPSATPGQLLAGAYGIDGVGTRWVQRVEWARGFAEFKAGGKRKRNCPSVRAGDTLATIHLADGAALRVTAHVAGKLVEVNPLLETCPDLAVLDVRDPSPCNGSPRHACTHAHMSLSLSRVPPPWAAMGSWMVHLTAS